MDIHSTPIEQRIDWLLDYTAQHSVDFTTPDSWLARSRYLACHPTSITVLKCMDGRINFTHATQTPQGIILPIRNLGGMFDLGWPYLGETLTDHVQGVVSQGRRSLILINYHFSKGNPLRGCAGFNYDVEAAKTHAYQIKSQVEHVFGVSHSTVYPVVCGFETDDDALILHGSNGDTLDMSQLRPQDRDTLLPRLERLFPDMSQQMRQDLLPLMAGNLAHIEEARRMERQLDNVHREWMICVGRGFDFMHIPNVALIIGPYSPSLGEPIQIAAGIIESNMREGRIPDDGFLLLSSVSYRDPGVARARAELKARFLADFAAEQIRNSHPALAAKMHRRIAVSNDQSHAMEFLPEN